MKTFSCADSRSQLSESFIRELQMQGVPANNLQASCKRTGKAFSVYDLPVEFYFDQNDEGDTQLHLAIICEKLDVAELLIDIAPKTWYLDIANDSSFTALHCAVLMAQPRIIRKLVLAGANAEARTSDLETALHLAVKHRHVECIKALVEPVSAAEKEGLAKSNIPRPLPQLPVHVDARNYVGQTALHIAASKNDVQLVHELLLSGADVNAREGLSGKTALHMAIEKDNAEVVYYLAQIPTTLAATTYGGEAAYQIAVECGRAHYVEALLRFGAAPVMHSHDDDSMSEDEGSCSSDGDYDVPSYADFADTYSEVVNAVKLVTV